MIWSFFFIRYIINLEYIVINFTSINKIFFNFIEMEINTK
jgi:hypothetical protein